VSASVVVTRFQFSFAVFFEYYHATDIILASHRSSFVAGSRAVVGVLAHNRRHGGTVVE